jgi:protein-tyrosine phosphatase
MRIISISDTRGVRVVADKPAVLFVCLGNICRSPLAEAALKAEAPRIGLDVVVDSAGIGGWHTGEPPDPRARATAKRHGIDIGGHRARKVTQADFRRFSHVVALDHEVLAALKAMRRANAGAEVSLLLDHVEGRMGEAVADPYYGDEAGFEATWADVTDGAKGLARRIAKT